MASLSAWVALAFAALFVGTAIAIVTNFAVNLVTLGVLLLLMVVLLIVAIGFRSRRAAGGVLLGVFFVVGLLVATALISL